MKKLLILCFYLASCFLPIVAQDYTQYVDPRIGSVGLGRTFPGPSMPYGMAKPGPDGVSMGNAGWTPMPEKIKGFSQMHVSGTGGGQKYGNILLQPFLDGTVKPSVSKVILPSGEIVSVPCYPQARTAEDISLGLYSCTYESGINTRITSADRCALYQIDYGRGADKARLLVDVASFLGMDTIADKRETQQLVDCHIERQGASMLRGWSTVRGGWNNGGPYAVYFCLQSDVPFAKVGLHDGRYAIASFAKNKVGLKIGISHISMDKAQQNIVRTSFEDRQNALRKAWQQKLSKIDIEGTLQQKRMFYTAIYHTMLMPVDKSGENSHFSATPYYDDYYAIWDTYRTSMPLLTLIDEDRQRDMVNSLLNIYRHDGYMPDARSGNWNGRTQGGSNADIVLADAFAKGMKGIDYELALQAMVKDAEVTPTDNDGYVGSVPEEKHGRGGLQEYNTLGYIPYGIDRAGNRTVEYSYDDWCIAQVAKGLGHTDLYEKYLKRSANWRNLWRGDYEWQGMKGFIMPKDAQGRWLDSVPWGKSKVFRPLIAYKPDTKVAPWYLPWWSTFFYEALSAEYSLSIPHDVPGLIEACGGKEAFIKRLDTFFANKHYNVANEPSFLTPYLYHWAGRPDLSVRRIHQIVADNYSDRPDGLPGNDDSGAMSSWLVFNMLGFYPVAGQDLYLVGSPMIPAYTLHLPDGKTLKVKTAANATRKTTLTHEELLKGGEMILKEEGRTEREETRTEREAPNSSSAPSQGQTASSCFNHPASLRACFLLNRQYRNWEVAVDSTRGDTLRLRCNQSVYLIPRTVVDSATGFAWDSPQKGKNVYQAHGTFLFISRAALYQLLATGSFIYDTITWRRISGDAHSVTVKADVDGTLMTIATDKSLPWVIKMQGNPLGIDWHLEEMPPAAV